MEYKTRTKLVLPFKITLMVSNGGRLPETNNHNRPADKGSQNQTGKEKTLEDYGVFGIEVISPGSGVIAQVVDGSLDCDPGDADRSVGVE